MSATQTAFSPAALDHFASHAIDPERAAGLGVGEEPPGTLTYPGGRRRPLDGKPKQPGGVPLAIWWVVEPHSDPTALIGEGESDTLAAATHLPDTPDPAGLHGYAVGAVPGTSYPADRLVSDLKAAGITAALLAMDGDGSGREATAKFAEALEAAGIRPLILPIPDGQDLADVLAASDAPAAALEALIAEAKPLKPQVDERARVLSEVLTHAGGSNGAAPPVGASHLLSGAEFILDAPAEVPAVWGTGGQVLWAAGEPFYIVGPAGVGKTTLAQNLALRRHGIGESALLGFPVEVDARAVLYVAADRPAQAARSFARMVDESDRQALEWFKVHRGPFPFGDLAQNPEALAPWLESLDVGTVMIDSLKDVGLGLSEDAPGAAVNLALQRTVAAGIEISVLHHQRKASGDNKRPRTLSDVYGSTWLTAGAGSVLLLWGEAGDAIVELRHLKQPAEDVGPLKLIHDAPGGRVTVHEPTDLCALVQGAATRGGLTVREAASALFGSTDLDDNQIEKARRRLEALAAEGKAGKATNGPGGVVRYLPIDLRAAA